MRSSGPAALTGLVSDDVLTVGTELPAPPFWIGEDYDALTGGFEVDLAKEIAKRLNLVAEVLNIVRELAHEGMTMLLATHEPSNPRTQAFLKRIIAAGRL